MPRVIRTPIPLGGFLSITGFDQMTVAGSTVGTWCSGS